MWLQIIAEQYGDFQVDAGLVAGRLQGVGAGLRIDSAGIADHADVLLGQLRQQGGEDFDEVAGEARLRVLHACAGHDRQGDLGEVVEHQIIQIAALHQLRGGGGRISPECAGASDANGGWHFYLRLSNLRQKCLEATKQALGL